MKTLTISKLAARSSQFLTLLALVLALPAAASPTLVVVNQGSGTISFVDTATMTVIETIEAGNGPHESAPSPDGKLAAVTMYGRQAPNRELLVVDPSTQAIVKRFDLSPSQRPHGVAWRGGTIFVTLETEGTVAAIDAESGEVRWRGKTVGGGGHMLAATRDGRKIYTGNMQTSDVSAIRVGEEGAYKRIGVGAGPEGIALSPDEGELWAAHRTAGGISVIDTMRDEVVATIAPEVVSARLTFTPDGTKVLAYDLKTRSVVVYERATRKELGRLQPPQGMPVTGVVARDSRRAWVIRYQPDAVFELDLETMTIGRSVETGSMPDGISVTGEAPLLRRRPVKQ